MPGLIRKEVVELAVDLAQGQIPENMGIWEFVKYLKERYNREITDSTARGIAKEIGYNLKSLRKKKASGLTEEDIREIVQEEVRKIVAPIYHEIETLKIWSKSTYTANTYRKKSSNGS